MDALWIILIGVLLLAGVAGCFIVRRYESREPDPGERKREEMQDFLNQPTPRPEPPFDIPVLRDKPKINASDVDPTSGLNPDFSWDGKDR